MNKKNMLSLIGITAVSLAVNSAAPVLAAETETPPVSQNNASKHTAALTKNPEEDQSKSPATGSTSRTPKETETKPNKAKNSSNLGKALSLINKYVKLTKNSYVYTKKGKRIKNLNLKKGQIVFITGFTNVKNKDLLSYVDFTKSKKKRYVKMNNVKYFKAVQYRLKKKGYVYNSKGKARRAPNGSKYFIKKGKIVTVFKIKKIKGARFVGLGNNVYIKWSALNPESFHIVQ